MYRLYYLYLQLLRLYCPSSTMIPCSGIPVVFSNSCTRFFLKVVKLIAFFILNVHC